MRDTIYCVGLEEGEHPKASLRFLKAYLRALKAYLRVLKILKGS